MVLLSRTVARWGATLHGGSLHLPPTTIPSREETSMKKTLTALGTVTALALSIMIAPAATAGPHGCYTYSAKDGHAIGSYCPYSAPYSRHQGWGRFWFESGYSANRWTEPTRTGAWAETGYHYGGHLTSHWQNRW